MKYDEPINTSTWMDGFIWWMGVVENMDSDLLAVGRAKVRIFGWHSADVNQLPTNDFRGPFL
jgi:hypothetical protein